MRARATTVIDGLGSPESLRWHDGALWFSDLARGAVHRYVDGQLHTVAQVPGRAGGLGWLPDGRLLVVSMDGRRVFRQEPDGELVEHADLRPFAEGVANDMLVDGIGRAYVGNFGFDYHARVREVAPSMLYAPPGPPAAPIACFDPGGVLIGLSEPLLFPNGCVLLDDETLVVAETLGMRLTAFTVKPDGTLTDPRPWAGLVEPALWRSVTSAGLRGRVTRRVSAALDQPWIARRSPSPVAPDGIGLHPDGTIWVANALRGECVRVAAGGRILTRIRTSQPALSCVLGGEDGRTLFAATVHTNDPEDADRLSRGRIETFRLPVAHP